MVWGIEKNKFRAITQQTVKLALPIVFGQLGLVFMGFFDLLMLRDVGTEEIAAVGIANALFFLFFLFALGVMFSISPLVAIACGSGRSWKSWLVFKASCNVAVVLGIGLIIIYGLLYYVFPYLKQTPGVERLAREYLIIVSWSALPMLLFVAAKHYLDGLGRTVPASVITLAGLVSNIILNKILIFGMGEIPPMGLAGAAWATSIVRLLMLVAILMYVFVDKESLNYRKELIRRKFSGRYFRKIWVMGIPIGFQFFFEVAAFSFAAIMAGWLGEVSQASHNVALQLASVTYMGATGMAAAGSIMIGNAYGAAKSKEILEKGKVVLILVFSYMLFCALMFVFFRTQMSKAFSENPEMIAVTSGLLVLAAFFQISDGLQSAGMGLLRGMKDVKIPSLVAFISYWIIGIPVSYIMGFVLDFGINGVWIGFIVGLSLAAALIIKRFFGILKKIKFEEIDEI